MEGKKGVGDFVVRACSLSFARLEREKDFELAWFRKQGGGAEGRGLGRRGGPGRNLMKLVEGVDKR